MIRLNQPASQLLSLITTQNGANVVVSYSDKTTTAYSGNTQVTNITSATTTTICDTPAASTIRDVDHISINNTFAGSHTITVQLSSSATLYPMLTIALLTNETAEYTHGSGWKCFDANGNLKTTPLTAMTSAQLAAILSDETGTDAAVFANSPTLVTPALGVATATSINKVAITAPATSATLTIADGKTLTANRTLTLTGTDGTTMTFPATSATIARTDTAQTFTGTQTFGAIEPTSINGVTTDSTSNRPETHMSMMPHVASKAQAMCIDLTASATVGGLTAADNANLDQGTNNFTLAATQALPDYTPAADVILCQKTDGTNGYKLSLLTTGKLRLTINTTNYDSTVATGLTDGVMATLGAVITRESATAAGSVVFKVNELTLGASVAITAGTPTTVDNASAFYIGGTATTRYAMRYKSCRIFNRALTDAQWVDFVKNGVTFADIGASTVNMALGDNATFATAGNWVGVWGTVTGGYDSGDAGHSTCLRYVATSAGSNRVELPLANCNYELGKRYRVTFDLKRVVDSLNQAGYFTVFGVFITTDADSVGWHKVSAEFVVTGTSAPLRIYGLDNAAIGDEFLIDNFESYKIGATTNLDVPGIQPNQVHDSANDNHLAFPTSGASLSLWKETGQYNWTTAITGDTTLTSIVPAGYELEKILFKNSTAGAVSVRLGTTAGGTEAFGLTALNTSATFGGHKTILVNQGFSATAAQTLYLSSTDWTGGGTPPSLTFTMYFRRIS